MESVPKMQYCGNVSVEVCGDGSVVEEVARAQVPTTSSWYCTLTLAAALHKSFPIDISRPVSPFNINPTAYSTITV